MIFRRLMLLSFLLSSLLTIFCQPVYAQDDAQNTPPLVVVLTADGPVAPPMAEYISRGIRVAEDRHAEAIIIELDTPGGNVDAMTDVVKAIRASEVPVITAIGPKGRSSMH